MGNTSVTAKLDYLKKIFGAKYKLGSDGINVSFMCPNRACLSRNADKLKFTIRLDTDQSHCWVCGFKTRNNLLKAITMATRNVELINLYTHYKVSNSHGIIDTQSNDELQQVRLPIDFQFLPNVATTREGSKALIYLKHRKITEKDIWRFKIGISNSHPYKSRVLIPSFDLHGEVNYFVGRTIEDGVLPKYVNPDVDKLDVIFNEYFIDWKKELVLTEGVFDLMKCSDNATSLQGSNFNKQYRLFRMIIKHKTPVLLALDADVPNKIERYARLLSLYDIPVRILQLDKYKDVGEMTKDVFLELQDAAITWTETLNLKRRIDRL